MSFEGCMDNHQHDLEELHRLLHDLLLRVSRLEHALELLSPSQGKAAPLTKLADHQSIPSTSRAASIAAEPSFANPDLESRIGSQWLNRVGIAAVLVGVSLFLKYAFESKWVGPAGRVSIGLLAGIAIILWSEWFRVHGYRVFSYSLKALGLGILYLSLWASFQVYDLISWMVTFMAMLTVTASTTTLALWQEAETLALFALLGGFATPVLLYTGENRELQLFTYIAVLNVATLVLAGSRPWRRLLLVSLLATSTLYFAWYATFYRPSEHALTLEVTTIFFVIFAIAPLVERAYRSGIPNRSRVVLYVSSLNAAAYFLELYLVLGRIDKVAMAWCAIALAALYLLLSGLFRARPRGDIARGLRHLHLALSIIFITLAIAIRVESRWISMGWFVEASALMTIGFWRRSPFLRWQALVLISVMIAKVFVYDIWGLERGYRILSFVLLGMLLLVVSFVYQRDWLRLSLAGAAGKSTTRKAETRSSL
jgi:uncharacterized membrane protein